MRKENRVKFLKLALILFLVFSSFPFFTLSAEAKTTKQLIVVNKAVNQMAFFDSGKLVKIFDVATGKTNDLTPEGTFRIVNKIINRPYYTANIPGGDSTNPLGDRWLGLETRGTYGTTYALHGTVNEASIGSNITSGCIRMYNDEIRWLFPLVELFTPVHITTSKLSFDELAFQQGYLNESQKKEVRTQIEGIKLDKLRDAYNVAITKGDIHQINQLYDGLTKQVKLLESLIGQTAGAENRKRLNDTHIHPAKVAVERTIYEVSQLRLINSINGEKDINKAKQRMATLDRLKKRAVSIKQAGGYELLPVQVDRTLRSLEATAQGTILANETATFNFLLSSGNIEIINQQYDELTKQVKLTETRIGQVYGSANRQNLNTTYVTPAKKAVERVIYEVSMHRLMNHIETIIQDGNVDRARSEYAKLERLERRAAEIKLAGGYDQLPRLITDELTLRKNIIQISLTE